MSSRDRFGRWALASALLAVLFSMGQVRAQSLPDWSGVWVAEGLEAEISGFPSFDARPYKLLSNSFPWNEEGRARVEAAGANQADQKADGWGFPLMMDSAAPFEFVIAPHMTLIVYVRASGLDRVINDAYDNDRSEVANGLFTIVPPED